MGLLTRTLNLERRSHPAAPSAALVRLFGGTETAAGVPINEFSAMRSTVVFACARVIAEDTAKAPLNLYTRRGDRGKELAAAHPLFRLLHDEPNPEMTSQTFREALTGHIATWGNAYAEIEYDGAGRVKALWPLRPDRVSVERIHYGPLKGLIVYRVSVVDDFDREQTWTQVLLPPQRMFHIVGFGFNGVVGYSPIEMAREAIGLNRATEEFSARFFSNDARPGGYLQHPGSLSKEAQERLIKDFEKRHKGLSNAQRLAVLEEGLTFKEVGLPQRDAQFIETAKLTREQIIGVFRVKPHKVANLEFATYSNIEQQSIEHETDTLEPYFVRWEQTINWKLLRPEEKGGLFAQHDRSIFRRADSQTRSQAYQQGLQGGYLCPDDVREAEGMNPLPDGLGQIYMVPLNMVPLKDLANPPEVSPPASAAAGPPSVGPVPDQPAAARSQPAFELRSRRSAEARRRVAQAYVRVFRDAAGRLVRRERADVMRACEKYLNQRDQAELEAWLKSFYAEHREFAGKAMAPVILSLAEQIQSLAAQEVNGAEGMTAEIEAFMDSYVAAFAARYVASSQSQLESLLKAGLTDAALLDSIKARFAEWEEKKPEDIARRETTRVANAVARETFRGAGITKLEWLAHPNACEWCRELNGRIMGIDQAFAQAGEQVKLSHGPLTVSQHVYHPPAHDGCVCSLVAVRE